MYSAIANNNRNTVFIIINMINLNCWLGYNEIKN